LPCEPALWGCCALFRIMASLVSLLGGHGQRGMLPAGC
jgi:hypothetical protein